MENTYMKVGIRGERKLYNGEKVEYKLHKNKKCNNLGE